jgi:hypothetical protein
MASTAKVSTPSLTLFTPAARTTPHNTASCPAPPPIPHPLPSPRARCARNQKRPAAGGRAEPAERLVRAGGARLRIWQWRKGLPAVRPF